MIFAEQFNSSYSVDITALEFFLLAECSLLQAINTAELQMHHDQYE
jgi:hypothetical protein